MALGLEVGRRTVLGVAGFSALLVGAARSGGPVEGEGLIAFGHSLWAGRHEMERIASWAARGGCPATYPDPQWVRAGGLASYNVVFDAIRRRAASIVDEVLRGRRPADIPVEQPSAFHLAINQAPTRTVGLSPPTPLLARPNEVIGYPGRRSQHDLTEAGARR